MGSACAAADEAQSGTTTLWGLTPGAYLVQITSFGQQQAAFPPPAEVQVATGKAAAVTIQALPPATLEVSVSGTDGTSLTGACFAATTIGGTDSPQYFGVHCDGDDGAADGRVGFTSVPAGEKVTVLALVVPAGWTLPIAKTVSAKTGSTRKVTLTTKTGGSALAIHRVDAAGVPLTNTCYDIYANENDTRGALVTLRCDWLDPAVDGTTHIAGLAPGDYVAVEYGAPAGVELANDTPFTIVKGTDIEITIPAPSTPTAGTPVASPVASR